MESMQLRACTMELASNMEIAQVELASNMEIAHAELAPWRACTIELTIGVGSNLILGGLIILL